MMLALKRVDSVTGAPTAARRRGEGADGHANGCGAAPPGTAAGGPAHMPQGLALGADATSALVEPPCRRLPLRT